MNVFAKAGFAMHVLAMCSFSAGCATRPSEPRIVVKEVKVAVPVACVTKTLGDPPNYPDSDAAIKATQAEPGEMLRLLAAGRLIRIQRLSELELVASSCR